MQTTRAVSTEAVSPTPSQTQSDISSRPSTPRICTNADELLSYYLHKVEELEIRPSNAFVSTLQRGHLQEIELQNNYFGENGFRAIFAALRQAPVVSLNLRGTFLQLEDVDELRRAFAYHPTLTYIDLSNNVLGHQAAKRLLALLVLNPPLVDVRVDSSTPKYDLILQQCMSNKGRKLYTCLHCGKRIAEPLSRGEELLLRAISTSPTPITSGLYSRLWANLLQSTLRGFALCTTACLNSFVEALMQPVVDDLAAGPVGPSPPPRDVFTHRCMLCGIEQRIQLAHPQQVLVTLLSEEIAKNELASNIAAETLGHLAETLHHAEPLELCSRRCAKALIRAALLAGGFVFRPPPDSRDTPLQEAYPNLVGPPPTLTFTVVPPDTRSTPSKLDFSGPCAVSAALAGSCDPYWLAAAALRHCRPWMPVWGVHLRLLCQAVTCEGPLPRQHAPFDEVTGRKDRDRILNWETWQNLPDFDRLRRLALSARCQAFFAVLPRPDLFTACLSALWSFRHSRRAVIAAAKWRPGWTQAKDGVLPDNKIKGGLGTAFAIIGQRVLSDGGRYLILQPNLGAQVGDGGLFYMSKTVANRELTHGVYFLAELPMTPIARLPSDNPFVLPRDPLSVDDLFLLANPETAMSALLLAADSGSLFRLFTSVLTPAASQSLRTHFSSVPLDCRFIVRFDQGFAQRTSEILLHQLEHWYRAGAAVQLHFFWLHIISPKGRSWFASLMRFIAASSEEFRQSQQAAERMAPMPTRFQLRVRTPSPALPMTPLSPKLMDFKAAGPAAEMSAASIAVAAAKDELSAKEDALLKELESRVWAADREEEQHRHEGGKKSQDRKREAKARRDELERARERVKADRRQRATAELSDKERGAREKLAAAELDSRSRLVALFHQQATVFLGVRKEVAETPTAHRRNALASAAHLLHSLCCYLQLEPLSTLAVPLDFPGSSEIFPSQIVAAMSDLGRLKSLCVPSGIAGQPCLYENPAGSPLVVSTSSNATAVGRTVRVSEYEILEEGGVRFYADVDPAATSHITFEFAAPQAFGYVQLFGFPGEGRAAEWLVQSSWNGEVWETHAIIVHKGICEDAVWPEVAPHKFWRLQTSGTAEAQIFRLHWFVVPWSPVTNPLEILQRVRTEKDCDFEAFLAPDVVGNSAFGSGSYLLRLPAVDQPLNSRWAKRTFLLPTALSPGHFCCGNKVLQWDMESNSSPTRTAVVFSAHPFFADLPAPFSQLGIDAVLPMGNHQLLVCGTLALGWDDGVPTGDGEPLPLRNLLGTLPWDKVDASLSLEANTCLLFCEKECCIWDATKQCIASAPVLIKTALPGLPPTFYSGVDCAVAIPKTKVACFFRDDKWVTYNLESRCLLRGPLTVLADLPFAELQEKLGWGDPLAHSTFSLHASFGRYLQAARIFSKPVGRTSTQSAMWHCEWSDDGFVWSRCSEPIGVTNTGWEWIGWTQSQVARRSHQHWRLCNTGNQADSVYLPQVEWYCLPTQVTDAVFPFQPVEAPAQAVSFEAMPIARDIIGVSVRAQRHMQKDTQHVWIIECSDNSREWRVLDSLVMQASKAGQAWWAPVGLAKFWRLRPALPSAMALNPADVRWLVYSGPVVTTSCTVSPNGAALLNLLTPHADSERVFLTPVHEGDYIKFNFRNSPQAFCEVEFISPGATLDIDWTIECSLDESTWHAVAGLRHFRNRTSISWPVPQPYPYWRCSVAQWRGGGACCLSNITWRTPQLCLYTPLRDPILETNAPFVSPNTSRLLQPSASTDKLLHFDGPDEGYYLQIRLRNGRRAAVVRVGLRTVRTASSTFAVQFSDDGRNWQTVALHNQGKGWCYATWQYAGEHEYWRMLMQEKGNKAVYYYNVQWFVFAATAKVPTAVAAVAAPSLAGGEQLASLSKLHERSTNPVVRFPGATTESLTYAFTSPKSFTNVALFTRAVPSQWLIQASDDGRDFTTIATLSATPETWSETIGWAGTVGHNFWRLQPYYQDGRSRSRSSDVRSESPEHVPIVLCAVQWFLTTGFRGRCPTATETEKASICGLIEDVSTIRRAVRTQEEILASVEVDPRNDFGEAQSSAASVTETSLGTEPQQKGAADAMRKLTKLLKTTLTTVDFHAMITELFDRSLGILKSFLPNFQMSNPKVLNGELPGTRFPWIVLTGLATTPCAGLSQIPVILALRFTAEGRSRPSAFVMLELENWNPQDTFPACHEAFAELGVRSGVFLVSTAHFEWMPNEIPQKVLAQVPWSISKHVYHIHPGFNILARVCATPEALSPTTTFLQAFGVDTDTLVALRVPSLDSNAIGGVFITPSNALRLPVSPTHLVWEVQWLRGSGMRLSWQAVLDFVLSSSPFSNLHCTARCEAFGTGYQVVCRVLTGTWGGLVLPGARLLSPVISLQISDSPIAESTEISLTGQLEWQNTPCLLGQAVIRCADWQGARPALNTFFEQLRAADLGNIAQGSISRKLPRWPLPVDFLLMDVLLDYGDIAEAAATTAVIKGRVRAFGAVGTFLGGISSIGTASATITLSCKIEQLLSLADFFVLLPLPDERAVLLDLCLHAEKPATGTLRGCVQSFLGLASEVCEVQLEADSDWKARILGNLLHSPHLKVEMTLSPRKGEDGTPVVAAAAVLSVAPLRAHLLHRLTTAPFLRTLLQRGAELQFELFSASLSELTLCPAPATQLDLVGNFMGCAFQLSVPIGLQIGSGDNNIEPFVTAAESLLESVSCTILEAAGSSLLSLWNELSVAEAFDSSSST